MKKIVRLTENDLVRLVKKVVKEQNSPKSMLNEMQESAFKSFIENFKSNPTPEQSKMKESILQCIRKGSYPHLGPMIAMGGSCLLATLGFVLAAFTFGFSAPLATIGLGGCVGSTAMGTGDFWKGVESEVAQIKKCVGA